MGILELIVVLVTIAGLFIWNRTESRADIRHVESQLNAIREMTREMHKDWIEESKSFHNRLCEIERNRKQTI